MRDEPWLIVLGAGFTPAEMISELGPIPSGLPPIGGVPAVIKMIKKSPIAKIVVVLHPEETELARLLRISFPGSIMVFKKSNGSIGDAFLSGFDALAEANGLKDNNLQAIRGYVVYADTVANYPDEADTILAFAQPEKRWTTFEIDNSNLLITEKNTDNPLKNSIVGVFHFSNLNLLAQLIRGCDQSSTSNYEYSTAYLDCENKSIPDKGSISPMNIFDSQIADHITDNLDRFHKGLIYYHAFLPLHVELASTWLDVGHLDTYHDARRSALVARWFNNVFVDPSESHVVIKTGIDRVKLAAEASWYINLPSHLQSLTPRFLGVRDDGYSLEYIPSILLSEQFVFGRHSDSYWSRYLHTLDLAVKSLHSEQVDWDFDLANSSRRYMWITKSIERINQVINLWPDLQDSITINGIQTPGLNQVLSQLVKVVEASRLCSHRPITRIHGDLHSGNMLYDHRTASLKFIDPRGSFNVPGSHGDPVYDLVKLYHGFLGRYDSILFDCFEVVGDNGNYNLSFFEIGTAHEIMSKRFRQWMVEQSSSFPYLVSIQDIELGSSLLFLSLAALHWESKEHQRAFILRGLQLWRESTFDYGEVIG